MLCGWLVGWLAAVWFVGRLVGWTVGWLVGWLASLLAPLAQIVLPDTNSFDFQFTGKSFVKYLVHQRHNDLEDFSYK